MSVHGRVQWHAYQLLKTILEPPVLFAVVAVYAVSLRLLTERFGK